ncbi:MAG: small multi-drug export protein [Dehalococcoidales bacterium]|nr:small multi-drug export protein [Dehalococcoidales bacterium]
MVEELIRMLDVPNELLVIVMAALPVIELRGAIPAGIGLFHLEWYVVFVLAIVGNLLPVPFLLLFFQTIANYIRRGRVGAKLIGLIVRHAEHHTVTIEKYKGVGLMIFVAIPLPWTGAWTGAIVASLLGMTFKRSFFSIMAGVIISGVIVTTLVLSGWVGVGIVGLGLMALAIMSLRKM